MIVLDTNVLSELAKAVPDRAVMAWADLQFADELYATAISEAEMLFGIDLLPTGRRRAELERAVRDVFVRLLAGRSPAVRSSGGGSLRSARFGASTKGASRRNARSPDSLYRPRP